MNEFEFYNQCVDAKSRAEFDSICSKVNKTTLKYLCFSLRKHVNMVNRIQRYLCSIDDLNNVPPAFIDNMLDCLNNSSAGIEKILDNYTGMDLAYFASGCGDTLSHVFAKYLLDRWKRTGYKIQFSNAAYTYIVNSINNPKKISYVNIIPCVSDLFKEIIDIASKNVAVTRVNSAIILTNLTCGFGQTAVGCEQLQIFTSTTDHDPKQVVVDTPKQVVADTPKQVELTPEQVKPTPKQVELTPEQVKPTPTIITTKRPIRYHDFISAKINDKSYTGLTDFFLTLLTNSTLAYEQLVSGIVSKEELTKATMEGRSPLSYLITGNPPNAPQFISVLIAAGGFDCSIEHPLRLALSQCKHDNDIGKFEKVLMRHQLFTPLDLKSILLILYNGVHSCTDTVKSIIELLCKYKVINVTLADYPLLSEFHPDDMKHFVDIVLKN